jgi:ribosomal protein S18 acetylase RimI-like enzyme
MDLRYSENEASEQAIYSHLLRCNEDFIPSLKRKVDISAYAKKIFECAVTFEAWSRDTLIGLVAAYFNDHGGQSGYITSVSTIKAYMGKGVASILIKMSIDYARQHGFRTISLEVEKSNSHAIKLYKKFRFQEAESKDTSMIMRLCV